MDKVIIDGVDVSIPVKLRPNRTDLTGKKFGKLTVIKPVISAKIGRKVHSRWLCQCECGNYKVAYTFSLLSGNTRSCGCLLHKPNTYVKRLKAENERIKRDFLKQNQWLQDQKKEIDELKTENERLKKQYNCYACDSCGGKEDYINMKRHTGNAIKTVHKYSQALQEIRDIANEGSKSFFADEDCDKILAKINEVIGV